MQRAEFYRIRPTSALWSSEPTSLSRRFNTARAEGPGCNSAQYEYAVVPLSAKTPKFVREPRLRPKTRPHHAKSLRAYQAYVIKGA